MTPPSRGTDPMARPGAADNELGFDLPAAAAISKWGLAALLVGALLLIGVAFVVGYLPRQRERAALAEGARALAQSLMRVEVVTPRVVSSDRAVLLPGSIQPLKETVLYARASGFVQKWLVDMGDRVEAGQLLAEIETPEVDQELDQARAQLAQARPTLERSRANVDLSAANLKRYEMLTPAGVTSQAELDGHKAQARADEADVHVAEASISNQRANIRRLTQIKAFATVTAPFAGTITQRWVEVGALVTAGNGQPLYKVAALDPARVLIQVPQDVAPGVRSGQSAKVSVREYSGRAFDGIVTRSAGELDATTRTMNTEVRVANPDGALMPGMYAEVAMTLPSPHHVLELPATALLTDAKGPRVAVVDEDARIHLVPVVVDRDTGANVEISTGLTGNERIAKLASAEFVEGRTVEVVR
jgi:membrane fusion protein (multidrug efflux system)